MEIPSKFKLRKPRVKKEKPVIEKSSTMRYVLHSLIKDRRFDYGVVISPTVQGPNHLEKPREILAIEQFLEEFNCILKNNSYLVILYLPPTN